MEEHRKRFQEFCAKKYYGERGDGDAVLRILRLRNAICRSRKFSDCVSTFEDRGHDVSTFGDRCVDFRRSMCRPSEMDVLTFEDR